MLVMPSNSSGLRTGYLCGKYSDPIRIGWLLSPGGFRIPPTGQGGFYMPVALDNGAFGAFLKSEPFNFPVWLEHLKQAHQHCKPIWMVVPDVVTNAKETLDMWGKWAPVLRAMYPNTPLAIAVQDGMMPEDVLNLEIQPEVIFVGGSTHWKLKSMKMWCDNFKRVHIARVNTESRLWKCHNAGAESVDGTGFFRGDQKQTEGLYRYLEESTKGERPQLEFNL